MWIRTSALLLHALVIASCATPKIPDGWSFSFGAKQATETTTTVSPTIRFLAWQGTGEQNMFVTQGLSEFAQSNPIVRIEYDLVDDYTATLLAELETASPPDLFWVPGASLTGLLQHRYLSTLSESQLDLGAISDIPTDAYQRSSVAYCRPRELFPLAVIYNRSIFEQAGLPGPPLNWKWNDLLELAARLTNVNTGQYGLVLPVELSRLITFAHQSGMVMPTGPLRVGDWDQASLLAAIEFYLALFAEGNTVEPVELNSTWTGDALGRGAVAMTIEASWILPYLHREYPGLEFGVASLPAGPISNASLVFTSCVAVHARSQVEMTAQRLAAHMSSPSRSLDWGRLTGSLPPQKNLRTAWLSTFATAEPFMQAIPNSLVWQWDADEVAPYNTVLRSAVDDGWTARDVQQRFQELATSAQ